MSKIYKITLHDDGGKTAYTWDLDSAKEFIFNRYEGKDAKMINSTGEIFYWGIYDKDPLIFVPNEDTPKLLATIHEVELQGKRIKFTKTI